MDTANLGQTRQDSCFRCKFKANVVDVNAQFHSMPLPNVSTEVSHGADFKAFL